MKVREAFPSEYLAAEDLPEGKDAPLTIHKMELTKVWLKGKQSEKLVMHFVEMQKREGVEQKKLVTNKTNATTVAKLYGSEMDNWPGKTVALYRTTTKLGRETVPCIRIREQPPKQKASDQ